MTPTPAAMTAVQRDLARHALGLPNRRRASYRNRFIAGGGEVHAQWMAMVDAGWATRRDGKTLRFGGDDLFCLTRAGAEMALESGEELDSEDFP